MIEAGGKLTDLLAVEEQKFQDNSQARLPEARKRIRRDLHDIAQAIAEKEDGALETV